MSIVAQGRRARTLRRRVLDWRAAARYFAFSCDTPWPRSVGEVLDYLASIVEGSKGRSALCRAVCAIGFMENAGGVNEADRLSSSPLLKAALEELTLRVSGGVSKPVRKAPQVPVALAKDTSVARSECSVQNFIEDATVKSGSPEVATRWRSKA